MSKQAAKLVWTDQKLMSKFGGHGVREINRVLDMVKEGSSKGGGSKLSKLRKLERMGKLTKLSVKPATRASKKPLAGSPHRRRASTPKKKRVVSEKPTPASGRMARRKKFREDLTVVSKPTKTQKQRRSDFIGLHPSPVAMTRHHWTPE